MFSVVMGTTDRGDSVILCGVTVGTETADENTALTKF